jgi:nucleoid DNA-binding protein
MQSATMDRSTAGNQRDNRAQRTITRVDLADRARQAAGVSFNQAVPVVDAVLEAIVAALVAEHKVKLPGFGNFVVSQKGARQGCNPKTLVSATITARHVVVFKASRLLKQRVSKR